MSRVRVGHAGCGSVSIRGILPHLTAPDAKEVIELVAVCDMDVERAKAVAVQFGAERHYGSYDEMVAADDIDLIIIATPIFLHAQQSEQALKSGKHVFVNKSMALNLAEADRVMEAMQASGKKLAAAPGQMLAPAFAEIRQMIRNGDFGKMYWGFANNTGGGHGIELHEAGGQTIRRDPTWYYTKPSGGPIYDMGVYSLHSLTGLLGPVQKVTAMSGIVRDKRVFVDQTINVDMDDNTWMILDFGDNCFVTVGAGLCQWGKHMYWGQLALYGSDGGLEVVSIDDASGYPKDVRVLKGSEEKMITMDISRDPLLNEHHVHLPEPHIYVDIMNLIDSIKSDSEPVASLAHARHVVEIIERAYESAQMSQTRVVTSTF